MPVNKAPDATQLGVIDIVDIYSFITSESTTDKLLEKILEASFKITGIANGFILLCDSVKLTHCLHRSFKKNTYDMEICESSLSFNFKNLPLSLINHVFNTKEDICINKPYISHDFAEDPYIKANMPETVLCLPLMCRGRILAVLYLEDSSVIHLTKERLNLLSSALSVAALALENVSLKCASDRKVSNTMAIIENISEGLCVFHNTPAPPYILFTVWNSRMTEITGWTKDEMNIYGWETIERSSYASQLLKKILQGENLLDVEYEIIRKDDVKRIIKINTYKTLDDFDEFSILVTVSDITEQKKLQKILESKETLMRELTENTLDMLSKIDSDGIFKYVTPSFKSVLGYDIDKLIGKNFYELIHPLDMSFVSKRLRCVMNSEFNETNETRNIRFRFRNVENKYLWMEASCKCIHGYNDNIPVIILSLRDITKRVKIQEALKMSEERYRLLMNLLPDAVYIVRDNKIYFSNKAGASFLGATNPDDLIGKSRLDYATPIFEDSASVQSIREQLKLKRRIGPIEEKFVRKLDNSVMDIEAIATEFTYDGKNSMLVVCRDISERRKAKLLQRQVEETSQILAQTVEYDKLRTEFFANISHELRTPINVVLSSLQLFELILERSDPDLSKVFSYIKTMKQNCYRLIRLINNLIDVTKIDAGYFTINLKNCNIVSIVEDITLSVVPYIETKGITLVFDTNTEEKVMACDPDKIERIILNLISNAFKFTEPGGNIRVSLNDFNDHIFISVKDTGIGIPEDKQQLIFQRFVQVDKSLAKEHAGSGIGLCIVKSLVELQDGTISLISEYGKGSEFIINLPVRILDTPCENTKENDRRIHDKIEKINIEFSDIYV